MIKRIKLIINTVLYHPLLFGSLIFEMLFVIIFSLNSINYISKEMSVLNFTSPFSETNFVCYMPISDFLYNNGESSYESALRENLHEERLKTYSELTGLESYSMSCTFSAENADGNFEVRAISGNVFENLNISFKKGGPLKSRKGSQDYVNCIVSDSRLNAGDIITVSLVSDYAKSKGGDLKLRVAGVMNPPYFDLNPLTSGVKQGFSDIFTFTSPEELSALGYSIIWVDYNDISDFINDNGLDKNKNSPIYSQLLFFDGRLTESQMRQNKEILEKNGCVFDYETSVDFENIKEYTVSQLPPLLCLLAASLVGFAVMIYLNVFLLKPELVIFRICGATEREIYTILNSMFFLAIVISDAVIALIMPLLIHFEFAEIDVSFVNYNIVFIILLNLIFMFISLSVSAWCQKKQAKIRDEFND